MGEIAKRLHRKLASKSHHLPTKAPKRRPGEPLPSGAKDIRTLIKEGCDPLHAVYRLGERDGKSAVEFTWDGHDEMEAAQGRGWMVLDGDELKGMLFIHHGDESDIVLTREPEKMPKRKRK